MSNNIQVAIEPGAVGADMAELEERLVAAGVEVVNDKVLVNGRSLSTAQMLAFGAAMGLSSAHFPTGISDGARGTALRRGRRHRATVIDTSARQINNVEIARHNAEVDRKNAEKRRAKESRRREEALAHASTWDERHAIRR